VHGFAAPAATVLEHRLGHVPGGMLIFSPLSISTMLRPATASATARLICALKRRMKR